MTSTEPSALTGAGSSGLTRVSDSGGAVDVLVVSIGPMRFSTQRSNESRA